MPERKPWSDEFIRHMIAKGSITPPLSDRHVPRWYWPVSIAVICILMVMAFYYGVYVR